MKSIKTLALAGLSILFVACGGNDFVEMKNDRGWNQELYEFGLSELQKKYPDWFKTLRFNSVYTNLSDVKEIVGFFRSTFNKVPTFSPLHPTTLGAPGSKTINGMLKRFVIPEYMEEDMDLISKNPRVKLIYDLILRSSFNFFVTEK